MFNKSSDMPLPSQHPNPAGFNAAFRLTVYAVTWSKTPAGPDVCFDRCGVLNGDNSTCGETSQLQRGAENPVSLSFIAFMTALIVTVIVMNAREYFRGTQRRGGFLKLSQAEPLERELPELRLEDM